MALTFYCPRCGKRFDREESLAGKRARCKDCQHVFVIPCADPPSRAAAIPTRSRPARPASRASPAPGRDPSDFPTPPAPPPAVNTFAEADEEWLPPRPGKPVAPAMARSKRQRGTDFAWLVPITMYGILAEAALVLLVGAFVATNELNLATISNAILRALSVAMLLLGLVVFYVAPFLESVKQGLLCVFVPFYSLYYLITRWELMKRPFYQMLSVLVVPLGAVLLFPTFQASNLAQLRAQEGPQVVMGGTALARRPALPRPGPAFGEGDSVVLIVEGVRDVPMSQAVGRQISAILKEMSPGRSGWRAGGVGRRWTYTVSPVRDPQALADRITFGTVTSVQGRTINVTVTPEHATREADATSGATPAPAAPAPPPGVPRRHLKHPPARRPLGP